MMMACRNGFMSLKKNSRRPLVSSGEFKPGQAEVTTYKLVGPMYFLFFAGMGGAVAVLFVFVAGFYRERTYVRDAAAEPA